MSHISQRRPDGDGGLSIQRFLQAGLIRHLTLAPIPVLIGQGIPLFSPTPGDIRAQARRLPKQLVFEMSAGAAGLRIVLIPGEPRRPVAQQLTALVADLVRRQAS